MAVVPLIAEHIEIRPGYSGGRPRIKGHRITVADIVIWHIDNEDSLDAIIDKYPQLTLADLHAALAYYYDHRDEIRQRISDDEAFAEEMARSENVTRWNKSGDDDSDSS